MQPDEKHWHGASPANAVQHIGIEEVVDGRAVEWLSMSPTGTYHGEHDDRRCDTARLSVGWEFDRCVSADLTAA